MRKIKVTTRAQGKTQKRHEKTLRSGWFSAQREPTTIKNNSNNNNNNETQQTLAIEENFIFRVNTLLNSNSSF